MSVSSPSVALHARRRRSRMRGLDDAPVMDAHILSYFSVFYMDLFDKVFVLEVLIIRCDKMVSHVLPPRA